MQTLNNPHLFRELLGSNIIPRMKRGAMFEPGRWIDLEDQKLHQMGAIDPDVNWIYVNPDTKRYCMIYRQIETGFGFIPTRCLNCWKVVVVPRSFHELMQLYELMKRMSGDEPNCFCKCGVESRNEVNRHYGGYFYCPSRGTGVRRYKIVRAEVDKHLSPDVTVLLKRYCTEFEYRYGPSDKYKQPEGAVSIENEVYRNLKFQTECYSQPEWVKRHVIQNWMFFAWGRGDKTVTLYNDNKPLFPPYVTYHKEPKARPKEK